MTHRDVLQDQYEDAVFALLMDSVVVAQGERELAELERLNADPTYAVPEGLRRRIHKVIDHQFRARRLTNTGRSISRILQHIAVVALLMVVLFSMTLAASPALRKITVNFLIETFPESTDYTFGTQVGSQPITALSFGYLPEGYTLSVCDEEDGSSFYQYDSELGGCIQITCDWLSHMTYSVDTEGATTSTVDIQGTDGMLIEKDNRIHLVWVLPEENIAIGIIGYDSCVDDIFVIANHIVF